MVKTCDHTYISDKTSKLKRDIFYISFHLCLFFAFNYFNRCLLLQKFPSSIFSKSLLFLYQAFCYKKRSQKIAFLNSFKHCSKQHVFSSLLSVISKKYLPTFLFNWRQKKLHNSLQATNKNLYFTIQCYGFRTIFWRKKKERDKAGGYR